MCAYCIFVRAFCFDEFTSAFIVLTILSRSSFIFCLTTLNILSIISFVESALSTGISLLQITPFPVLYLFIRRFHIRRPVMCMITDNGVLHFISMLHMHTIFMCEQTDLLVALLHNITSYIC
jgi:hypothetical protein